MPDDPTIYERLNELNQQLRDCTTNEKRIELDILFHRTLLEASGLKPLVAFNDLLQIFFIRFRQSVLEGAWESGIEGHQNVINFLRDGNPAAAAVALRGHITYHKASV